MSRRLRGAAGSAAAALLLVLPAAAAAKDYALTARDVIPSGQLGSVPVPAGADAQARLYDGLTPLRGSVTPAALGRFFKSEALGAAGSPAPTRVEPVPRAGVTIVRDAYDVPHITGRTRDDVTWAMGWTLEEDRSLLLAQGRYPARIAALDAPNIDAFGLVTGLKSFTPTAQAERIIARQTQVLERLGAPGRALLHDVDVYVQGINDRLRAEGSTAKPFTRVDVYAVNALVGQIFGEGGGHEAESSEVLSGLRGRLGAARGTRAWTDLTDGQDPEHPVTLDGRFPYGRTPAHRTGNVVLDAGSFKRSDPTGRTAAATAAQASYAPPHASNFLMVGAGRSTNGHPLFVAGPQIGYYYPGLTLEADVKGPGFEARGATAPGFPGNILIGRGPDFAWTLTSAGSDLVDEYVETLCGGSSTRYRYRGGCREMGTVTAGTIAGQGTVRYRTTVHGPVEGYATVRGRRVAVTTKRASFGRDIEFQLPFRDATLNLITSARSFERSFARSPFTFNAGYADDRDVAVFSAGRLPIRAKGVDLRLPTDGRGRDEWRGFLSPARHPQGIGAKDGTLVNWNDKPALGWASADDNWQAGPVHRVQMLERGLARHPRHDLASVVGAMNRAATQDLRATVLWPVVRAVLRGAKAPSARDARMVALLDAFRRAGGPRLDANGDGREDLAGGAIMDALWPRITDAVMEPVLGRWVGPVQAFTGRDGGRDDDFTGGSFGVVDKDLRAVLGRPVRGRFSTRFCGRGHLAACRRALWRAVDAAGDALQAEQGADPRAWRAAAQRIEFQPGLLTTSIRYTNRPSGIQQVISFGRHRPRR